ncbi:MAG: ABC transporter substrate-binding protein [Brachymonas sp.]|nr:ABC transporter substrate-binding protein [Brachymonas sp.]NJS35487.1 ABC transporter substrate-binding protein [Brachymonas sp.]
MKAGIEGKADVLALWAPNTYTMQEKHGYEMFCNANDFKAGIYNAVITGREYAKNQPESVKAFLAVMMRSINWIKANPQQAQAFFVSNAKKEGVEVSANAAKSDYELRPLFNLDEQLQVMGGSPEKLNDSPAGRSFFSINVFLTEGKAGSRSMRPQSFIDISFMQRLKADPKLSAFANSR